MPAWCEPNQIEASTSRIGTLQFFGLAEGGCNSLAYLPPAYHAKDNAYTVDFSSFTVGQAAEEGATDPIYDLQMNLDRLRQMRGLGENWDSYGSHPPSGETVEGAIALVWNVVANCFSVSGKKAIPYSVAPLSGESVQIEWRGETDSIEVEVGSSNRFGYLLTRREGRADQHREEHDEVSGSDVLRLVASVIS